MFICCEIFIVVFLIGCLFNIFVIEILLVGFSFDICLSILMWKDVVIEWNVFYWNMLWILIRVVIKILIFSVNKNILVLSYK